MAGKRSKRQIDRIKRVKAARGAKTGRFVVSRPKSGGASAPILVGSRPRLAPTAARRLPRRRRAKYASSPGQRFRCSPAGKTRLSGSASRKNSTALSGWP
jgi:hypothetical protein